MGNEEVFVFTGGPPPNWLEKHSWFAPVQVAPAETMPVIIRKSQSADPLLCCLIAVTLHPLKLPFSQIIFECTLQISVWPIEPT
jgi:hypothetical protein